MAAYQEQLFSHVLHACERSQEGCCLHLVYHYRAIARYRLGKLAAAVQDSRTALAIDNSFTPASCCCAAALVALGKPQDATLVLHRALDLDPGNIEAKALLHTAAFAQAKQVLQAAAGPHVACSSPEAQQTPVIELRGQDHHHAAQQPPPAPASTRTHPYKAFFTQTGSLDLDVLPAGLRLLDHMFQPSPDGISTNLIILLHGLGDTAKPYAALGRRMALPQTATLALAGPLEVPETNGGRAWLQAFDDDYELIQPSAGEERRSSSLAASCGLVCELIHKLVEAGWQHRHIHLFGFSQGGTAALEVHYRFRGEHRLGGCVSIAGGMLEEVVGSRQAQASKSPHPGKGCGPVLITLGERDDSVSRDAIDRTLQVFTLAGSACRLHRVPGKGHGMISSEAEMRAVMGFWAETLSCRPPGEDVVEIRE